jgi:hypothetical protein
MSYLYKTRCFTLGLVLALLSGIMLFGLMQEARADERGGRYQEYRDSRYHHDRYYPARGQYIERMPGGHRVVVYGNSRYYFHGGVWYRPHGPRFVIVAPPFGMVVPFLPPFYATIWVGGAPYYYANDIYYMQGAGGYVVVEPPKGDVSQTAPPASQPPTSQIFIYPRQGQSEQKQATDRYECHSWAVGQAGYDPTKPPANLPEAQMIRKRADYQRAQSACLDGRGYTVK